MSLHIARFLDRIRQAESRQQREVILTIIEARDLHADITRLLLALNEATQSAPDADQGVNRPISIDGGTF